VAQQPAKSDRAIAREAGITDHKQVSRARKRGEATGAIAPVGRRRGADGKTRQRPKGKAGKSKDATAKKNLGAGGDSADLETSAAGGGQERAELDETSAPARAPLTRSETLASDACWAVDIAAADIDGARRFYDLLTDEERRINLIETLRKAIEAAGKENNLEPLLDVLVDALGVTDKTASDAIGVTDKTASDANGNDINPKLSADRMKSTFAKMADEPQIKCKKYATGWWWSATIGDRTLSCPTDKLFATQDEAQDAARAAIESLNLKAATEQEGSHGTQV
jgi:hypothetical protein